MIVRKLRRLRRNMPENVVDAIESRLGRVRRIQALLPHGSDVDN